MSPRTLILVIGTDSLEGILTRGGRVLAEQTHGVDPEDIRTLWESGLTSLDSPLEVLVAKLQCRPGDRVVVLGRPSVGSTVHREGAGHDKTLEPANELAAAHACSGFTSNELSTRTWSWAIGKASDDQLALISGSVPDAVLLEVERWVARAGLRFEGFVPLQMWETALAMRAAALSEPGTVCCRIGPEYTVLVARSKERGTVVRAVEFGTQVLAGVYERAALHREMASDRAVAWQLMFEHGVRWSKSQKSNEVVSDALPMLAPVLQRLNIELKQTLKYQVGAETTTDRLLSSGIGRRVPGLGDAIAAHLELSHESPGEEADEIEACPSIVRELDTENIKALLSLELFVPRVVTHTRRVRRLAAVAAQSGVIAALMVFGEHRMLGIQASRLENQTAEIKRTLEVYETSEGIHRRLNEERNSAIDQILMLDLAMGHSPHWPAAIRELTESDDLDIETCRITSRDGKVNATISGRAPASNGDSILREKMRAWRASGLVSRVEPTSLVRQDSGRDTWLQFTLEFEIQGFAVWFHRPELAAFIETEEQP